MGVIVEGIPGWAARIESQPALSAELELELARRTRAGDREARDRLLSANLRYALRYAKSLARYGVSVAELTNEGVIGLMEAVDRFDPERGVRFATYAAGWIRALVLERLVRQKSPIGHAGGAFRTKYWFALRRERAKLLQRGISGDELTRCVARRLGVSIATAAGLLGDLDTRTASPEPLACPRDTSPERATTDREVSAIVRRRLREELARFDERERALIERRFMSDEPESLAVLGREHGVTRERMRQLEQRAIEKLRRGFVELRELV